MIVRDEAAIIETTLRMLAKAIPSLVTYVIADTGSVDDTKAIIGTTMADVGLTGHVLDHKWEDFGTNRTRMLEAAAELTRTTAQYLFLWDADDSMTLPEGVTSMPLPDPMHADMYSYMFESGTGSARPIRYTRPSLIRNSRAWRYVGVLHEYLEATCPTPPPSTGKVVVPGFVFLSRQMGARSQDPDKYRRDARVFETALANNPPTGLKYRYMFYLGNSYRDAKDEPAAIEAYKALLNDPGARTGSWVEEQYVAALRLGQMLNKAGDTAGATLYWLKGCGKVRDRVEIVQELVNMFTFLNEPEVAYGLSKLGSAPTPGSNHLFLDETVAAFYYPYTMIIVCGRTARQAEGMQFYKTLFDAGHVGPVWYLNHLFGNLRFFPDNVLDATTYWHKVHHTLPNYIPTEDAIRGLARAHVRVEAPSVGLFVCGDGSGNGGKAMHTEGGLAGRVGEWGWNSGLGM